MKRRLVITCAAALILLLTAIGAQASAVLATVALPATATVDAGATLELDAVLTPSDTGATVTWTSSRTQYATVTAKPEDPDTCIIKGKAMGRTYIYAKVGGKVAAKCFVTVTAPKASSIKLNVKSVTLNPSGAYSTYTLRATTTPTYHSDTVAWTAEDPDAIIDIAPDGLTCLVTAKSDDSETKTCTVTATLSKSGKSAASQITVTKIPEKYVRVPTSAVVPLYATRTVTAVVYPTNAFDKAVTWEPVKNEGIVKFEDNKDGTADFTGLKSGRAVFKVSTTNGRWALCALTVKLVRYSSLSVTPSSKTVEKGKTYEIKIKRSPTYVSYPNVDITSSDDAVATVALTDGKWIVTGTGRGYAKIYVKADNGRVNRTLTVRVLDYENPVTVTVSAIGDVMLGGDPRKDSFKRFENLWNDHGGAGYFFREIKDKFEGVVFANLEIPLIDTNGIANGSRSYIFRGRTKYAQALSAGGVHLVDLDNNHIMDYGNAGLRSTKNALPNSYFGLGTVRYRIEKGIKIGFVGFRPENISLSKMKSSVKAVQSRCDVVIASFHWGQEKRYSPTGQQIAYGRAAVDAGADLVVGHHNHLVSGIEVYKKKYIVYGLGTIVSTVELPKDTDTFIYRHTFSVTGTSVSNVDDKIKIIPVKMTENKNYNDAQPVSATGKEGSDIIDKIKKYSPNKNLPLFS